MNAVLRSLALSVLLLLASACGTNSTTVMTGPGGEQWDAQTMVGHCFTTDNGIQGSSCDATNAAEAIHVGHSENDCPSHTTDTYTWPPQSGDPGIVVCLS
jgi:hypothetical protein